MYITVCCQIFDATSAAKSSERTGSEQFPEECCGSVEESLLLMLHSCCEARYARQYSLCVFACLQAMLCIGSILTWLSLAGNTVILVLQSALCPNSVSQMLHVFSDV